MNEKGNAGQNVMELIAQLEGKVRQKNREIDEYRRLWLLAITVGRPIPFLMGVLVGMGFMGVVWGLVRVWH